MTESGSVALPLLKYATLSLPGSGDSRAAAVATLFVGTSAGVWRERHRLCDIFRKQTDAFEFAMRTILDFTGLVEWAIVLWFWVLHECKRLCNKRNIFAWCDIVMSFLLLVFLPSPLGTNFSHLWTVKLSLVHQYPFKKICLFRWNLYLFMTIFPAFQFRIVFLHPSLSHC